jgi:hypothetical protein
VARVRRLILNHRTLSAWLIACALMMKILVPGGFMPVVSAGAMTIQICAGTAPVKMAMPGMAHHQDKSDHQAREMPCAFSGLSAPSLAAADMVILALAIVFILGRVFRSKQRSPVAAPAYLRPPLRGPPPFPAVI